MSFEVIIISPFEREVKHLAKKYKSLKSDLQSFFEDISNNPLQGTPLGKDCYKIRLDISSKGKGKSGGARVITCVKIIKSKIYMLAIYDKTEKEDISNIELQKLLEYID